METDWFVIAVAVISELIFLTLSLDIIRKLLRLLVEAVRTAVQLINPRPQAAIRIRRDDGSHVTLVVKTNDPMSIRRFLTDFEKASGGSAD